MAGLLRAALVLAVLAVLAPAALPGAAAAKPGGACAFRTVRHARAAFCETFSRTHAPTTRSGTLDGVLWGVSRATSATNPPQGQLYQWAAARQVGCGPPRVVAPERDIGVCHGQAVETVNDDGGQTNLAFYPRQPFDFAGRTGTVSFDVSDDTQGGHAAWPAFAITDQPVPAPYSLASGLADNARNSVGFTLAAACGQFGCGGRNTPKGAGRKGFHCVGVDTVYVTRGYALHQARVIQDGCVRPAPRPLHDDHFEVRVDARGIRVYGSDPGAKSTTRLIAHARVDVPLTRGLVWLEDVHYNANKFDHQQTHTFSWDDVAFDGPVLPRDLGFDVLDHRTPGRHRAENGLPTSNLGWFAPAKGWLTLRVPHVRAIGRAHAALLELTYWAQSMQTLTYSLNGHRAHRLAWPFPKATATYVSQTIALPVPVRELRAGSNRVQLRTSDPAGVGVANVDLILAGAGG